MPARRIVRDVNEAARDVARALDKTEAFAQSRRDRKKVEMHARTIINRYARTKAISPRGLNLSSVTLHKELMAS